MDKRHLAELPTPITDAAMCANDDPWFLCQQLERDAMTFALRLYAEDQHTFAPETADAMDRWAPRVRALLQNA